MAPHQNGDGDDEVAQVDGGQGPIPGLPLHCKVLPGELAGQGGEGQQASPQTYLPNQGCQALQLGFQHSCLPAAVPSALGSSYTCNTAQPAHGNDIACLHSLQMACNNLCLPRTYMV